MVTENCATRAYGQPNPTFTGTLTGALNGDTFTVTYSTTATQFSPVGTYPITAVVTGTTSADYVVTVVPCSLSVTPAGTGGTSGLTVTSIASHARTARPIPPSPARSPASSMATPSPLPTRPRRQSPLP